MKDVFATEYQYAMFTSELCEESLCGPNLIILKQDEGIIIYATELDPNLPGMRMITPYDRQGVKLILVPWRYVADVLTSEEAEEERRRITASTLALDEMMGSDGYNSPKIICKNIIHTFSKDGADDMDCEDCRGSGYLDGQLEYA